MLLEFVTDCAAAQAITRGMGFRPSNPPPPTETILLASELAIHRGRLRHGDNPKAKVPRNRRLSISVTDEVRHGTAVQYGWHWRWFPRSVAGDGGGVRKDRLKEVGNGHILIGTERVRVSDLAQPHDHQAATLAGHWSLLAKRPPRHWIRNSRGEPIDDVVGLACEGWKPGTKVTRGPARSQVITVNGIDRCEQKHRIEIACGRWITLEGLPGLGPPAEIPPALLASWAYNDGMLSREEELELVRRVLSEQPSGWCGHYPARTELLRAFFYLINKEARGKDFRGLPREDLQMAGVVALLEDLARFDLDKGYRLSTFLAKRIHGAMLDEQKLWQKQGRHGETRDERWLIANHWKYADRQLIGGSYSASGNPALIAALMAAMACPNTGIKNYTRQHAIEAIGRFEAAQATHESYDTTAEGGYADGDERQPEMDISDSPSWVAVAVENTDTYRPLTDAEWQDHCRQRAGAHYTDAKDTYITYLDANGKPHQRLLTPWDAHLYRGRGNFPTYPAPLRRIGRSQYEADQRTAHGADITTRIKLLGKEDIMSRSHKRPVRIVTDMTPTEKARLDALADRLELTKQQALRQLVREAAIKHGIEAEALA
jgi:Sigma-70 region 2